MILSESIKYHCGQLKEAKETHYSEKDVEEIVEDVLDEHPGEDAEEVEETIRTTLKDLYGEDLDPED